METEEIIELSVIALIVAGIGFIVYETFKFLNDSGATAEVGKLLQPVGDAADTLIGSGGAAGVPGTNSNLFYTGINNFIDGVDNFFSFGLSSSDSSY